jgi:hypothetical protein
MTKEICACGRPLHYIDPSVEAQVRRMVANLGEYATVAVGGRKWKVQRHYIALHGLKAQELPTLGFEEIV